MSDIIAAVSHEDSPTPALRGYVGEPGRQMHFSCVAGGRPVILLHQAPSSHAMWDALVGPLARRGYEPIAADLPGHGMSDALPSQPSMDDYARAVARLADELGLDGYDVVGHHTGVVVALALARRHRGRIGRIVGWGVPLLDEEGARRMAGERPPNYGEDGREVVGWWKAMWRFARDERVLPDVAVRSMAEVLATGPRRADAHNALGATDVAALLREVPVEVLVLAGRGEMLREETIAAAELSSLISYGELGENGFYVADESPEELAEAVDAFLSGGPSAAAGS